MIKIYIKLNILCFLLCICMVGCKRNAQATVSQDIFLTHCGYIKCALMIYSKEKSRNPKEKSEINEAMEGWNELDVYGRSYDIIYFGVDTYSIRSSGKDGIPKTRDDIYSNITLPH